MRAHLLATAVAALALAAPAQAQQKRIYLAPDDHTDMIWSQPESYYYPYFSRSLDFYLGQIDASAGAPSDQQARWNTDGTLWLWAYEQDHTPAEVARLMDRVRDGHVGVPLNTIVSVHGATPLEGVLRDHLAAGRYERRYGLKFELAISQENQTLSYGLGALMAGSGALYFHKGVCQCGAVDASGDREVGAYWWRGADGSRILSKWMSLEAQLPGTSDRNQGPGGYAEAYLPRTVVPFVATDAGFRSRWPYDVIGLVGQGWDYIDWLKPNEDPVFGVPAAARDLSDGTRRIISSNMTDFFRDFGATYGAGLPVRNAAFGNDWEVCTAAFAGKSGRVKRALEGLRAAEGMATIAALVDPAFLVGREGARDTAFRSVGLFFEHNVCGGGNGGPGVREAYQEAKAVAIEAYVGALAADAGAALGRAIPAVAGETRIYAYNPLGWTRTDVAEAAAPGTGPLRVVEADTGAEVATETVGDGAARRVRWLASNVSSIGYRVYALRDEAPTGGFPAAATYSAGTLTSTAYQITMTARGALSSAVERATGRQLVAPKLGVNDFGTGSGTVTLERAGPVSATVRVDIGGSVPRTARATLYAGVDRIDLEDRIGKRFSGTKTFAFNLNVATPVVRHEEVGAVLKARTQADANPGDYSARPQNVNVEWLTLGHFAATTAGDGGAGVLLTNADAYFVKLAASTRTFLDTRKAKLSVLAGRALTGIPNQAGDNAFLYRFALAPIARFDAAAAMRTALEHGNPLVTGAVAGPASAPLPTARFAFLTLADPDQLVWAVKPAEDGITAGVAVRVWNLGAAAGTFAPALAAPFTLGGTVRTTHIETELPDQTGAASIPARGLATWRLSVAR